MPLSILPDNAEIGWARNVSNAARELWTISQQDAILRQAGTMDPRSAGPPVAPATINPMGCWLSNAAPQKVSGYIIMATLKDR